MDGESDYKQTIDVDGNGVPNIIKYGIDDPEGSGEIYWYTVIQDFESNETKVSQNLEEELRTEWFDIDDQTFAYYDFNVIKLLISILVPPLMLYTLSKMMLPDVDYWAQKSTQRQVNKEEHSKTNFYSVQVDEDRDGLVDKATNFDTTEISINYEVTEFKKTLLAAKLQNVLTFVGEYIMKSVASLFGSKDDFVFNEFLTEEHLDSNDFSTANLGAIMNAPTLRATYRKFTENVTTSYTDTVEHSTLTFLDYYEGEIKEQRIYKDDFKNNEVESVEGFFKDVSSQHSVTNVDTNAQAEMLFDPEIPHSSPANITWTGPTWSSDNVPIKYDSLQVIDENNQIISSTNKYEKKIILRIPNRYSLYNDFGKISKSSVENEGWVEIEVTGAMVTPADGQVYYTSDIDAFTDGSAKTSGNYFFVDSDQNSFFETVYIISNIYTVSRLGIPIYDVISIGLNYDGIHDFAPYEKLDQVENTLTDFSNLAKESRMFGSDWIYNFDNLKNNDLLFEILNEEDKFWKKYKTKDQIFEIYKTSKNSEENPKFTELFYEIRHKSYARAWDAYRKQLIGDIAEQVFMSLTAAFLSAAVEAIITASTLGFGWLGAKGMAILTYIGVYTLMTKFSIDRKLHVAEAKERSEKFYPSSSGQQKPTSLNEKNLYDRFLQDIMAAAIIGHPGGYYATVSGEDSGATYTGQLLVSPPNPLRLAVGFLTDGFYELLIENFVSMGESDPDAYTALDFDDVNLDYLLMTSELPYYNTKEFYTYLNTKFLFNDYNLHSYNTLGALETIVMEQSGGSFDAIKPNKIAGTPNYEFIDSSTQETILPLSTLYRPVVLSLSRFLQLKPALGRLIVTVQCKDYEDTLGINAYNLDDIESTIFEAKVPLNDNGFEYPITSVYIDVVLQGTFTNGYFAQNILVNDSYYATYDGNLYFTLSIESIISEMYTGFKDFLAESWASELTDDTIFYNIKIEFERFIPDTTEETSRLALAQATSYTIMDYFNQFTFAEISANMISEITYTETLTFWSTLISAPLAYFGSWAITAGIGKLAGEAGSKLVTQFLIDNPRSILGGLMGTIVSPIKEVFQEIIEDGFIEAIVGNLVEIAGGSEDLGFWLSSIATSVRESGGALGQLALGGAVNLKSISTLIQGLATKTSMTEIRQQISQQSIQQQNAKQQASEQRGFWSKLLRGGFLKGMFMVTSSAFFGAFGFAALSGLKRMTSGVIKASPSRQAILESIQHNRRKKVIRNVVGTEADLSKDSMFTDRIVKSSELDGVNLDLSEDTENRLPFVEILSSLNSDPKNLRSKQELANKFEEFRNNNFFEAIISTETQTDTIQTASKRPETSDLEVSINIGNFDGLFLELGEDLIHRIYLKFYDPNYYQKDPKGTMDKLIYNQELFNEAREFLKTTTYHDLEIVLEDGINWKVFEILRVKFDNGEKLSKLERIITDVGAFYMGGYFREDITTDQEKDESLEKKFYETKQSYSTLEFISDLMEELQRHPEILAKYFPERTYHYTQSDFSQFWKENDWFIGYANHRAEKINSNYKFKEKDIYFLKVKSTAKFGAKALGLVEIIKQYTDSRLTVIEFISMFKNELGRLSGDIKVTKKQLSNMFGMGDTYISEVILKIENPKDSDYSPSFKFSKEVLGFLTENLGRAKYSLKSVLEIILKYESLSPDLKEYSKQQYTITEPYFFSNMLENTDAAYWFGFFSADGWVSKDNQIGMELSLRDEGQLKKLANLVGFPESRLKRRTRFNNYRGEIRKSDMAYITFLSKPMSTALKKEGLYDAESEKKSVPNFVRQAIEMAKKEATRKGIHWSKTSYGEIAHSWLLGFYDGDGSYRGGFSAVIGSTALVLIEEIKELFEITNDVRIATHPGELQMCFDTVMFSKGFYTLHFGPDVFHRMLDSYIESLSRKRPQNYVPRNYGFGDFPFVLSDYYDPTLVKELIKQGIIYPSDTSKLVAIARSRENRIIWLEQGDFNHILSKHGEDFKNKFKISDDPKAIGNFIFYAISKYPIVRTEPGRLDAKICIYEIRRGGDTNYLYVVIAKEGFIITAYER